MTDVTHPYADDHDRFSLLYRLPVDEHLSGPAYVIRESGAGRDPDLRRETHVADTAQFEAQVDESCFAVLALPATLDHLSQHAADRLLGRAVRRLLPGGVLVGHVSHRHSIRNWIRRFRPGSAGRHAGWSVSALRHQLGQAGLADVEMFYVRPLIASPMALVPTIPAAANAFFRWSIRSARDDHGGGAYAARRLLAAAGLGWLLQDTIVFWGYRAPC